MESRKTYKREFAGLMMLVTLSFYFWSAYTGSEHIKSIADTLLPFASALGAAAFGADWWSRQYEVS